MPGQRHASAEGRSALRPGAFAGSQAQQGQRSAGQRQPRGDEAISPSGHAWVLVWHQLCACAPFGCLTPPALRSRPQLRPDQGGNAAHPAIDKWPLGSGACFWVIFLWHNDSRARDPGCGPFGCRSIQQEVRLQLALQAGIVNGTDDLEAAVEISRQEIGGAEKRLRLTRVGKL